MQCILIYLQPLRCSCRSFGITHGLPRIRNTPCLNQLDQCVPVLSLSIFDDLFTRQCARLWLPSTRGVAAERADFCFLCSRRLPHKPFSAHTLHIDCISLTFQCFLRVLLPSTVAPCLMFATILAPACPTAVRHAITPVTPHLLIVLAACRTPRSSKTLALMHQPVVPSAPSPPALSVTNKGVRGRVYPICRPPLVARRALGAWHAYAIGLSLNVKHRFPQRHIFRVFVHLCRDTPWLRRRVVTALQQISLLTIEGFLNGPLSGFPCRAH